MSEATRQITLSFITELPLHVEPMQENILLIRLEAARQVYNACLGECLKRLRLKQQSRAYQQAKKLPRSEAGKRQKAFAAVNETFGFREFDLHKYATQFTGTWLNEHLDSMTIQKIASRAFSAVEQYAFGKRGKPRFKSYGQLDSVEGKKNQTGLRYRDGTIEWKGLTLHCQIDPDDTVQQYGLQKQVKYVRLVRRKLHGKNRFYAQLVCEGLPFHKDKHPRGKGQVGLDLGPSTIAGVAAKDMFLLQFCENLADRSAELGRLNRKMDRQRCANNPHNYNENGTIKSGAKLTWNNSKNYLETKAKRAEIERQLAAHRKSLHGRLVNRILAAGNDIRLEKISYRAWQKQYGKSVSKRAPAKFVSMLKRKAASAGASVTELPTRKLKLSQTCHHCGKIKKKSLSQRWHKCECGITAQRDLYSAFLAACVEGGRLNTDLAKIAWSGVDARFQMVLSRIQMASGGRLPASFGVRKQSHSSETLQAQTKTSDVVPPGSDSGVGESRRGLPSMGTPRL